MNKYSIDRKTASQLLKVSTRTVDRYIKAKKLSTRVVNGRVWLNREEVQGFVDKKGSRQGRHSRQDLSTKMSTLSRPSPDKTDSEVDTVNFLTHQKIQNQKQQDQDFKKIQKVLPQIHELNQNIADSKYQIGKLESQLENSIPLSVHYQHLQQQKEYEHKLRIDMKSLEFMEKKSKVELKFQKFIKWIILLALICILILQPLWLLLLKPS